MRTVIACPLRPVQNHAAGPFAVPQGSLVMLGCPPLVDPDAVAVVLAVRPTHASNASATVSPRLLPRSATCISPSFALPAPLRHGSWGHTFWRRDVTVRPRLGQGRTSGMRGLLAA